MIHIYPVTGVFLIAALLAGTGVFPFATFHSELLILNASVISKHYLLATAGIICLAIMFMGVGKIVLGIIHGQPKEPLTCQKREFLHERGHRYCCYDIDRDWIMDAASFGGFDPPCR